jgi:hypothetical protein
MMRHILILILSFAICMLTTTWPQGKPLTIKYRAEPLMPVLLALDKAKASGSLEFSGNWDAGQVPTFPPFAFPKTFEGPLIPTLREILAVVPTVQVTEDRNGLIRMIDPSIPTDILNVRISHIEFRGNTGDSEGPNYNPDDGLTCIKRTPEVTAFAEAHGFDWLTGRGGPAPGNFGHWPPQFPHMSGSLDNVTVSEALDHILQTFPGIWVYENYPANATEKRNVYLGFFYLRKSGNNLFVDE